MLVQGRRPGFVRVLDEHTLAFPNYDGNGMYLSMGNVLVNPHVGMLFIDFSERPRGCALNGVASIDERRPAARGLAGRAVRRARDARRRCSRTARATSTGWSWSSARGSCRASERAAGARLEAHRLGVRRAARRRPGATRELTWPAAFAIMHADEFEQSGDWLLARRSSGSRPSG